MRISAVIIALCLAIGFAACGGGSTDTATTVESDTAKQVSSKGPEATSDASDPVRPQISVPPGPPPKHLVVNDLKIGTGAEIKVGDRFSVRYVSFNYDTGDLSEDYWDDDSVFTWTFGPNKVVGAWAKGLPGMKVGGRRELIAPSQLAYDYGAMIWVVELLSVGK